MNVQDDVIHPHRSFDSYRFDISGFTNYLQGIAGGNRNKDTAKAIVHDVKLFFFQSTPSTSNSDIDTLFNRSNLEHSFKSFSLRDTTSLLQYQKKFNE